MPISYIQKHFLKSRFSIVELLLIFTFVELQHNVENINIKAKSRRPCLATEHHHQGCNNWTTDTNNNGTHSFCSQVAKTGLVQCHLLNFFRKSACIIRCHLCKPTERCISMYKHSVQLLSMYQCKVISQIYKISNIRQEIKR